MKAFIRGCIEGLAIVVLIVALGVVGKLLRLAGHDMSLVIVALGFVLGMGVISWRRAK